MMAFKMRIIRKINKMLICRVTILFLVNHYADFPFNSLSVCISYGFTMSSINVTFFSLFFLFFYCLKVKTIYSSASFLFWSKILFWTLLFGHHDKLQNSMVTFRGSLTNGSLSAGDRYCCSNSCHDNRISIQIPPASIGWHGDTAWSITLFLNAE